MIVVECHKFEALDLILDTHWTIFIVKTSNYYAIIVYFNNYNILWLHVQLANGTQVRYLG